MNEVYLCLGGNIGNRKMWLSNAIEKIAQLSDEPIMASPIYETEAWGAENHQPYLNQCLKIYTLKTAPQLIEQLLLIEKDLGRTRTLNTGYESRTIDIDILFYNKDVVSLPTLTIPHPRLHLRKFVLLPLSDIAPNYLHPVLNKSIINLLHDCKDDLKVKLYKD